jgi:hypothetical protein
MVSDLDRPHGQADHHRVDDNEAKRGVLEAY